MILSAHQPQYLPWLGYFHKICHSDVFVFLDNVQYKKREYQNRNYIRTDSGKLCLTVPVIKNENPYPNISCIHIDNSQDWNRRHFRSLCVNYAHTPFFKKYTDLFENIYMIRKWDRLIDLNMCITGHINRLLGLDTAIYLESQLNVKTTGTQRIIDICKAVKADLYLSGAGGKAYIEEDKFAASSIELKYQAFLHPVYRQSHMNGERDFISHLSALDLIFNCGPDSLGILAGKKSEEEYACVKQKN